MNTYPATLADLALFAEMASQLDHVKSLFVPGSAIAAECAALSIKGHAAAERLLGDDVDRVYLTEPEEETPA